MVSTHVFFVRVRRERGRDKKSSLLFPELQRGGNNFYRKKGLVSTKANLLSLHMLCLENNNWVSFIFFPLLSCPGSNCNESAVSSSLCAVNSWPFHLRSLNDLKKRKTKGEETRWGNNNLQSLWSPLFHLFCLDNPPLWGILHAGALAQRQLVISSLLSERSSPQPTSAFCATSFWTHTRCNPYTLLSSE